MKGFPSNLSYKCSQVFGSQPSAQKVQEEDIITALKFDHSGDLICAGDRAGRVILFQTPKDSKVKEAFDYYSEFQSHTHDFDPLRSLTISPEIVAVQWLRPQGRYHKFITANQRTVKMWKLYEKAQKKVIQSAGKDLNLPKLQAYDPEFVASLQLSFPVLHQLPIHSVGVTHNEEYLLSGDLNTLLLWSFQKPKVPFIISKLNALDSGAQEVQQAYNFLKISPNSDSLYLAGTSHGQLEMIDSRISYHSGKNKSVFKETKDGKKTNFLSELIKGFSDASFSSNGKEIISRDLLSIKVWDICNQKKPLQTIPVEENIGHSLAELFEMESLQDRFKVHESKDGAIITGNYTNCFHVIDQKSERNLQYEVDFKRKTVVREVFKKKKVNHQMVLSKKVVCTDINNRKNLVAVASQNSFFTYALQGTK